jgi:hypothetical protein
MPTNNPPPLLVHINEIKKEIVQLRGDISFIKNFIEEYEKSKKNKIEPEIVDKPEIPFKEISESHQSVQTKGWWW